MISTHWQQEFKEKMEKTLEVLKDELKKIRVGKASVSLLDSVRVNYYGSPTPLQQTASISCPDARSFLIVPWEVSLLKEIETSILKSNLGMTPVNDGKVIRLRVPDLTEERRKELGKNVKKIIEDARVAVRMIRRDANEMIKHALKDKEISEDDNKRMMDESQKLTDQYIEKIDKIGVDKEKDLELVRK